MRIAIIALGSQGDVQPYIALGNGLRQANHQVHLITHENYGKLVTAYGLEFVPMQGNVQELMDSEEMRKLLGSGNFIKITAHTAKLAQQAALDWTAKGVEACRDVELIIAGVGGLNTGIAIAEKLGLPLLQAFVFPFTPTQAFPAALFPKALSKLGGGVNRLSHHLLRQIMWQGFRSADGMARRQVLGLPATSFWGPYNAPPLRGQPVIYGFSPSVIAKPADWDEKTHVTGYWFLDPAPDWSPPPALTEFLERGAPPVYIGFGSMGSRNPEETAALVLQAVAQSGQRAVMQTGWSGMRPDTVPENVLLIDSTPHAWLFPRMTAVVHHGGAGTTAAGLRAGVPSTVIPFFGDQPFWGQRVADLGVGPKPIPRKQLTADRLAQAIQTAVSDQTMRQKAAKLGATIQTEDGIARAVAAIEEIEKVREIRKHA